jgi:NAD(P)H-hydrate epimerase
MAITDVNSEFLGVKRQILMENAGRGLADLVWEIYQKNKRSNIVVLCGHGGNGGDGMVAARHLARNIPVSLYLLGSSKDISKSSTQINFNILHNMRDTVHYHQIKQINDINNIEINPSSVIVDCLLGTGIKGTIREPLATLLHSIKEWQKQGAIVVSADTPTGIDPDTGHKSNVFLVPQFTGIFHKQKMGLNAKNSGKIRVIPIGVPPEAETIIGPGDLVALKKRKSWSKKGDNGKILVIGGNEIYSGAPALAAMAAIQAGADLVTILAPEKISLAIRSYSPELIVADYPSSHFISDSVSIESIEKNDIIVLGPGLGQNSDTQKAVSKVMNIVKELDKPIVIDADALKMLNLTDATAKTILTPHAGEFEKITGISLPTSAKTFQERVKKVEKISKQHSCTWVVKGHWDIVTDKFRIKINNTGIPRMTRGGTGDILAGLIAGFLPQTKKPFYAACIGTYINGRSGELAEKKFSLLNLLKKVPAAVEESIDFIRDD